MITKGLEDLFRDIHSWPIEDQLELEVLARDIRARQHREVVVSDAERAALTEDPGSQPPAPAGAPAARSSSLSS